MPQPWKLSKSDSDLMSTQVGYFNWLTANLPSPVAVVKANYIAQENIPKYSLVTSDGYKANSSSPLHRGKIIGIADNATTSGFGAGLTGAITTTPFGLGGVVDIEGSLVIPPGGYVAIYTSTASGAAGGAFSFQWEEVPI